MNDTKKVIANTSILAVSRFLLKFLGFVTTIILARYLGVELFGQYSTVLAFIGIFLFLNDFGIAFFLVRELSRKKNNTKILMRNAVSLKIIFSILSVFITALAAVLFGYNEQLLALIGVFSFSMISGSLYSLFSAFFQSELKMYYDSIASILQNLFLLFIVVFFASTGGTLFEIMLYYTFSTFVVLLAGIAFIGKDRFEFFIPNADISVWKKLLVKSFPFALNTVFIAIYSRIDVIIISKMLGDYYVGLYSAGFRLTESLSFLPLAFLISLYPLMSRKFTESKESLKKITALAIKFLVTLFLPIATGIFILAQRILGFVYGQDFIIESAVHSLQWLAFASLFIFLNYLLVNLLNSIDREKAVIKIIVIGIVSNILLNLALIPLMGITGAALATFFAEIIIFTFFYSDISRNFYRIDLSVFAKPIAASVLMASFTMFFSGLELFSLILLSGTFYFTVFLLMNGFSEEEKKIIKTVLAFSKKQED